MSPYKVGYLVGSLAKASINRRLAAALVRLAPEGLEMSEISFKDLPLYSYDYDADYPPVATEFKNAIAAVDAVLFVTPEYNRSVPGVLKNAIDIVSRPYGQNAFDGKPGAVVSVSPSNIGAFGSNHHLRQSLVFLNVPVLQQPEVYLSGADKMFDEDGKLKDPQTREFLQDFTRAFEKLIARFAAPE